MLARLLPVALLLAVTAACGDDPDGDDGGGGDPDAGGRLIDARPGLTRLVVMVTDRATGAPLPAKVVLYDEGGLPVRTGKLDMYDGLAQDRGYCELGAGVIATWDGIALADGSADMVVGDDRCSPKPAVPFGRLRVRVMHGIDHEMVETTVDLAPNMGPVVVRAALEPAWTAEGALAADLHVHADPSGDSNVPESVRIITELVGGVQVIGASDHNWNGDYEKFIDQLKLRGQIASLAGNEVTIDLLHANVFPARIDAGRPNNGARSYDELKAMSARQLMDYMRALPGTPWVQLNHPRLLYAAYFDYTGWNGASWPPPMPIDFDGVEILTGWYPFNIPTDQRLEFAMQDFYTFMKHGKLVTATGNSDTHHLSGILAGVPRNYVFVPDTRLDPFDDDAFVDSLKHRRVMITSGPWLSVRSGAAGPGDLVAPQLGKVPITIAVRQASFVKANRVRVWVGAQLRETLEIPDGARAFDWSGELAVAGADSYIGVDVVGPDSLPLELTGEGLTGVGGAAPAAMINPILVDVNGDGQWGVLAAPLPDVDVDPPPGAADRHEPDDCAWPGPR